MSFALSIVVRSTVVLLFTAALSAILHRGSASVRHAVWAVGLWSAFIVLPASAVLPALDLPLLSQSAVQSGVRPLAVPIPSMRIGDIERVAGLAYYPSSEPVRSSILMTTARWWLWQYGLTLAWAAGFILVLRRLLVGLWSVRRLARNSSEIRDEGWQLVLDQLCFELSITRSVRLAIGGNFAPMTWGVFRNVILVPAAAAEWTEERRRVVLAHELAHVKRRDGFMQLLAQIVCAVYWFNPLVWYAAARLRMERESACDDHVLNLGTNAHDYATHLVQVARASSRVVGLAHMTISMAHSSQLETRLQAILDTGKHRHALSRFGVASLACAAIVVTLVSSTVHLTAMPSAPVIPIGTTLPSAGFAITAASKEEEPSPRRGETASKVAPEAGSPFQQQEIINKALKMWLEEDAVYIITDAEKNAFKALGTDAEREQFINQFWQRRDPTPGTAENEFKEEHHRRIAYANERYGWSKPGWMTDRGRIYILYGPPDSIEDHPSGGNYQRPVEEGGGTTNTYPFAIWTYRYVEGIGNNVVLEFVDPGLQGEYRLTVDPKVRDRLLRPGIN